MSKVRTLIFFSSSSLLLFMASLASAQSLEFFEGDKRTACEVIMCLSSGQRPDECNEPIKKFFDIRARKPSKTFRLRRDFLRLCPATEEDEKTGALADALASGAGNCSVEELNQKRVSVATNSYYSAYGISNAAPDSCSILYGHEYTDIEHPVYIGTPELGGYWAAPEEAEEAQVAYAVRLELYEECESSQSNFNYVRCKF